MFTPVVPTPAQQAAITRLSADINNLRLELMTAFPERDMLINQLMVALISGHHVMMYGTPGTGKTLLIKTLLKAVQGTGINGETPVKFFQKLDNETTLDHILGPVNLPHYEKTGVVIRTLDGYLASAHFASLDEILDAIAVLRGLHDILNERELNAPPQVQRVPLLSAFAATNRSPQEIVEMFPGFKLEAFNDRFLFVNKVLPLKDGANKDIMLVNFLTNLQVMATLRFSDIQTVVNFIRTTNQFPNVAYVQAFRKILDAFADKARIEITDRRRAWLTQLVEAQAILQGRTDLYYEDLYALYLGLVDTYDNELHRMFRAIATPIIEEGKKANNENIDFAESAQLRRLEEDLKRLGVEIQATTAGGRLGELSQAISVISKELDGVKPRLDMNNRKRNRLIQEATALRTAALAKI